MRSRYTAFVLGEVGYLRQTWQADYRPGELAIEPRMRWLGLEILSYSEHGDRARV